MFDQEEFSKVLDKNQITRTVTQKMMSIYVCEHDWWPEVVTLHGRYKRKMGAADASEMIKTAVSFCTLFPTIDKTYVIDLDQPSNNLFKVAYFRQIKEKDWFLELQKVLKTDKKIAGFRKELIDVGIFTNIAYNPYYRQAFNRLCSEGEQSGVELTKEWKDSFKKLVIVYGGTTVSSVFDRSKTVQRLPNWRSPYFFEREIHKVFSTEQLIQIKTNEMNKINNRKTGRALA